MWQLFVQSSKKEVQQISKTIEEISLLDTSYKVLSLIILNTLKTYATDIIREYQSGFIRGKSITNHIFSIRQVMEKYYEYNKELHLVFVDFKQAYDSINRDQYYG